MTRPPAGTMPARNSRNCCGLLVPATSCPSLTEGQVVGSLKPTGSAFKRGCFPASVGAFPLPPDLRNAQPALKYSLDVFLPRAYSDLSLLGGVNGMGSLLRYCRTVSVRALL